MKKTLFLLLPILALVLFFSCEQDQKPTDAKIAKDLSLTVDAEYTFEYKPAYTLRHEITKDYNGNKSLVQTITRIDTLPASMTTVKDTLVYEKNDEERDTIIYHLKEYQTYIKVSKIK
jgi:hypothetical protein